MRHFAANYVFDGKRFIRNACISFDNNGKLQCVGEENSGLVERERMIFYNGVLCPFFLCSLPKNVPLKPFLESLDLIFNDAKLPIILLENVDLEAMAFTNDTFAKEIL